jgi:hypothetical protein
MAILPASSIAQLAYNVGCRGNALVISIAVALAESEGNTEAVDHDSNGTTDYGLWQINTCHNVTEAQMFVPEQNAGAMWSISSQGTNWTPWSTFTGGAYAAHLATAQAAAYKIKGSKAVPGGGSSATTTGIVHDLNPLTPLEKTYSVAKAVGGFATDLSNPQVWERIGYFVAGAALILFALLKLSRESPTLSVAEDAALL